jgi:hypothetical protein
VLQRKHIALPPPQDCRRGSRFVTHSSSVHHGYRTDLGVTGSKFSVTFDSEEKLAKDEITELPSHPYLYPYFPKPLLVGLMAKFGLWAVKGIMVVPHEGSLNEKFPDVKTSSVKDIVGAWSGK